jgi:ribosome-associated toxin RatA of RatAB toxin-antitoxin module
VEFGGADQVAGPVRGRRGVGGGSGDQFQGQGVILTEYLDGPFKHLKSKWSFVEVDGGCDVTFDVDFEFRNAILAAVIGLVFNEAMTRVVRAFETRAKALYGQELMS